MSRIKNLLLEQVDEIEFDKLVAFVPMGIPTGKVFKLRNVMNIDNVPVLYKEEFYNMSYDLLSDYIDVLDLYQKGNTPRLETWMNDLDMDYTYGSGNGARTYKNSGWDALTSFIKDDINKRFSTDYNCCFVNCYVNEQQHLGWHSDDSPEMDNDHPIAILSLGVEREIWFRKIGESGRPDKGIRLGNGSLLIMKEGMQQEWQHRIPKNDRPCGVRLSLTFRRIKPTFKVRFP